MFKKIFLILIAILISINFIYGLGVSPGVVNIDFKPNLAYSFDMMIINSPPKDINAEIYVNLLGINKTVIEEFRNIASLEKTSLSFTKNEAEKKIKVDLKFPEGFSQGGIFLIGVGVVPIVESQGFGVRAGNEITLYINVPNEYVSPKYRIIKKLKILSIDAKSVKQGEKADIDVLIKSESDIILKEVYGKIKIIKDGVELTTIQTDKLDINPGEEKILKSSVLTTSFPSGNLNLDVEVFYGEDSTKGQGTLNIIGTETAGGFNVGDRKISWMIIFIVIFVVSLIFIILLLLFLLLRRKKDKNKEQMQQQYTQQ